MENRDKVKSKSGMTENTLAVINRETRRNERYSFSTCCSILKDRKPGNGGVAQLGEHLPCKQGVKGSIPFISTKGNKETKNTDCTAKWAYSSAG